MLVEIYNTLDKPGLAYFVVLFIISCYILNLLFRIFHKFFPYLFLILRQKRERFEKAVQWPSEYRTPEHRTVWVSGFKYRTFWTLNRLFSVRFSDHHLNTGPFDNQTQIYHLNTRLVRYSDGYCFLVLDKFWRQNESFLLVDFTFPINGKKRKFSKIRLQL